MFLSQCTCTSPGHASPVEDDPEVAATLATLRSLHAGKVPADPGVGVRSLMAVTLLEPGSAASVLGATTDQWLVRLRHEELLSAALLWPHWSGGQLSLLFRQDMTPERCSVLLSHPSATDELWRRILWARADARIPLGTEDLLPLASTPYQRALTVLAHDQLLNYDALHSRAEQFALLPGAALEIYQVLQRETQHLSFRERFDVMLTLL